MPTPLLTDDQKTDLRKQYLEFGAAVARLTESG
jgi:hypothetical protein